MGFLRSAPPGQCRDLLNIIEQQLVCRDTHDPSQPLETVRGGLSRPVDVLADKARRAAARFRQFPLRHLVLFKPPLEPPSIHALTIAPLIFYCNRAPNQNLK